MWSILKKVPCVFEKKVKFIVLGWNVLQMSIRSRWSIVSFKVCVSLLNFLFSWSIHRCEWGIKVSHYYCVFVYFPFHTCWHLSYILWCSYVGCICIYNYYIFFLELSFDHYVVSFFVSFHSLCFSLFYLIWVLLLLLSFGLYLHGISFSSPSLSVCMCPLFWGEFLVDNIYRGLVFVSIQPIFVSVGAFNPFTFKVIIDKYDPVAIYFIVLGSGLYTLFVFPV